MGDIGKSLCSCKKDHEGFYEIFPYRRSAIHVDSRLLAHIHRNGFPNTHPLLHINLILTLDTTKIQREQILRCACDSFLHISMHIDIAILANWNVNFVVSHTRVDTKTKTKIFKPEKVQTTTIEEGEEAV